MKYGYGLLLFVLLAVLLSTGCTEKQRHEYSHWKSDLIGLKRRITLYSATGTPIKSWEGRYKIEIKDGVARFIHEGKAMVISGTFIIQEM